MTFSTQKLLRYINRNNSAISVLSENNLVNHSSDTTIYFSI